MSNKKDHLSSTSKSSSSVSVSKSLSVIRSVIRFAVSTIVYHKLSNKNDEESTQESKEANSDDDNKQGTGSQNDIKFMSEDQLERCFIKKKFCGLDDLRFMDAVDDNDLIKDDNGKDIL